MIDAITTTHNMLIVAAIENLILLWACAGALGYCLKKFYDQNRRKKKVL
jgi:hypothetical protein